MAEDACRKDGTPIRAPATTRWGTVLLAVMLIAAACSPSAGGDTDAAPNKADPPRAESVPEVPDDRPAADPASFAAFAEATTTALLRLDPELATELGLASVLGMDNASLTDRSTGHQATVAGMARRSLTELDEYAMEDLAPPDRVAAHALRWFLEDLVALGEYPLHDSPVSFITGAHAGFPEFMADVHPVDSLRDASEYVDRLRNAGTLFAQLVAALEERAGSGLLPTERGVGIARFQIRAAMGDGPAEDHPLVADFVDRLARVAGLDASTRAELGAAAADAVEETVIPAYQRLDDAVSIAAARSDSAPGLWSVREGDAYYEVVLRHFLSMDLTPNAVHELGLTQVVRVKAEMTAALEMLGYEPTERGFAQAVTAAREDAGSFALDGTEGRAAALAAADDLIRLAESSLTSAFSSFPGSSVDVVRPRPGREGGTGAYYRPPPVDGSRGGLYYLSLGGDRLSKFTFATTTFHEAVPGHHFQISSQRENDDLHLHQRTLDFTGFVEGWALYAERLAWEAGLYGGDPYGNLGRLHMELLRAARMVLDTGIHAEQWGRRRAIDYLTDLGFTEARAEAEVDRYIVWPGQAPAYMTGMLEILRVRDEAQRALGDAFVLADFHDAILSHGAIPLDSLDEVVGQYVSGRS